MRFFFGGDNLDDDEEEEEEGEHHGNYDDKMRMIHWPGDIMICCDVLQLLIRRFLLDACSFSIAYLPLLVPNKDHMQTEHDSMTMFGGLVLMYCR